MVSIPLDITFFVPCLNEGQNVQATLQIVFEALASFPYKCEILAVDDGSTDNTFQVLQQMSNDHPPIPIRVIQNKENKGLGYNYFACAALAQGNYYMTINGDNVEPVEAIRAIISQLGKADMIIPFFAQNDRRNKTRRRMSVLFTRIVNFVSGNRIHYYNGTVLHKMENIRSVKLKTTGFGYQAELICKLLKEGKTYLETQVINQDRQRGSSKAFRLSNSLSITKSLLRISWKRFA